MLKSAVLIAVGCVVWAVGWYAVADERAFGEQVGLMNIAIVGFLIVCAGQMMWFLGGAPEPSVTAAECCWAATRSRSPR